MKKLQKGGKTNPPKVYTDRKQFEQAQQNYNDSLGAYNMTQEAINDIKKTGKTWAGHSIIGSPMIESNNDYIKRLGYDRYSQNMIGIRQEKPLHPVNIIRFPIGNKQTDNLGNYKKPIQPVVYQPQNTEVSYNPNKKIRFMNGKEEILNKDGTWRQIGTYRQEATHPIQNMKRINPEQMDLSSQINIQGSQVPFPKFQTPQQKGPPVYGPGNTIVGYSDNMNFKPAYQYTGAPNNSFNLQDKELLNNPEALRKYMQGRDNYKFPTQEFQLGGTSQYNYQQRVFNPFINNFEVDEDGMPSPINVPQNAFNAPNGFQQNDDDLGDWHHNVDYSNLDNVEANGFYPPWQEEIDDILRINGRAPKYAPGQSSVSGNTTISGESSNSFPTNTQPSYQANQQGTNQTRKPFQLNPMLSAISPFAPLEKLSHRFGNSYDNAQKNFYQNKSSFDYVNKDLYSTQQDLYGMSYAKKGGMKRFQEGGELNNLKSQYDNTSSFINNLETGDEDDREYASYLSGSLPSFQAKIRSLEEQAQEDVQRQEMEKYKQYILSSIPQQENIYPYSPQDFDVDYNAGFDNTSTSPYGTPSPQVGFGMYERANSLEGMSFGMGSKGANGRIDCSGAVCRIVGAPTQTSEDVTRHGKNFRPFSGIQDLQPGAVLGFDFGPKKHDRGRKFGIDHTGVIVKNPKTGAVEYKESVSGTGFRTLSIPEFMSRYPNRAKKTFVSNYQLGGFYESLKQPSRPIIDRGNFSNIPYSPEQAKTLKNVKTTQKKLAQAKLDQEIQARDAKSEIGSKFQFPDGNSKYYSDMNFREKRYVDGLSLQNKGRWNENEIDQPLLNSINPAKWIYDMAGDIGKAPLEARDSKSLLPYASAVGNPLVAGALGFSPLDFVGKQASKRLLKNAFTPNLDGIGAETFTPAFKGARRDAIDFLGKEETISPTYGRYGFPTQVSGAGMNSYPKTENKWLNGDYSSFGNMQRGVVNDNIPNTQSNIYEQMNVPPISNNPISNSFYAHDKPFTPNGLYTPMSEVDLNYISNTGKPREVFKTNMDWVKQSNPYEFGNEMRGIMKNRNLDYKDIDDVELFRKQRLKEMNQYDLSKLQNEYAPYNSTKPLPVNKKGGTINDNNGYLASNLHNFTRKKVINSNHITTQGMAFPIKANGHVLFPNTGDYIFPQKRVVEYPFLNNPKYK